jgi:hypothetical protein
MPDSDFHPSPNVSKSDSEDSSHRYGLNKWSMWTIIRKGIDCITNLNIINARDTKFIGKLI